MGSEENIHQTDDRLYCHVNSLGEATTERLKREVLRDAGSLETLDDFVLSRVELEWRDGAFDGGSARVILDEDGFDRGDWVEVLNNNADHAGQTGRVQSILEQDGQIEYVVAFGDHDAGVYREADLVEVTGGPDD